MKVRLLNLVAIAAIATGVQGVAQQQDDSLERALADLNSGLEVPATLDGSVGAAVSSHLSIHGDARARNTWLNPSGAGNDQKNVDVRIRLGFDFDVNEDAYATVDFIASENWGFNPVIGAPPGVGNAATGESPFATTNTGSVWQAYFGARNWLIEDSNWSIGRKAWTFGSGRILGTDDWDQLPATFGGIWFEHPLEGFNLEAFMITEVANARTPVIGNNGRFSPALAGDADLFGASLNFGLEDVPIVQEVNIRPYVLRYSPQGPNLPFALTGVTGRRTWYGAEISGAWEFVDWDIEGVWVDAPNNAVGATNPSTSNFNAYAFDFDVDLSDFVGEDLPAGLSPVVEIGLAAADAANVTVNPVYHDQAGLFDLHNRVGAPGVWGGAADTFYIGLSLTPVEDWDVKLKYLDFDDNNVLDDLGPGVANADASEIDVSVGTTFANGVQAYVGWARVDFNDLPANAYVVYGTLGLSF